MIHKKHPSRLLAVLTFSLLGLTACSSVPPDNLGVQNNQLAPCPSKPNCVSSFSAVEDKDHYIAPFSSSHPMKTWNRLGQLLQDAEGMTVREQTNDYLHVEATTPIMGFTDDVEFLLDQEQSAIQVRSASRVGYSDLGANRARLEDLREQLFQ